MTTKNVSRFLAYSLFLIPCSFFALPAGAAEEYSTLSINGESNITATSGGSSDVTWTRDGSTFDLTGSGVYYLSGTTTDTRLRFRHDKTTVVITNLVMNNTGVNYPCFDCDGHSVSLIISGTNSFTTGTDRPGIEVDASGNDDGGSSSLSICDLTVDATLIAQGGANGAGIGSKSGVDCGAVTIEGGFIEAIGGDYGAGIGGGKGGKGGAVTITGGTVHANSYGADADDIGAGAGAGQGTTVISGGSVHCQSGKVGPQPVDANSVTRYSVKFTGFAAGVAITNFTDDATNSLTYGLNCVHADDDGNAWLWLPADPQWVRVNGVRFWCAPGVNSDASLTVEDMALNEESIVQRSQNGTGKPAWTRNGSTVHLTAAGPYVVTGSATDTRFTADADCVIVLSGVAIDNSDTTYSPIECNGHTVDLRLDGAVSTLTGGGSDDGHAGVNVPAGSTLNITNLDAAAALVASGKCFGAGIGGNSAESCGTVNIFGGIVTAAGGNGSLTSTAGAAGIGGGANGGAGGAVTIVNGTVTAKGYGTGAGIGGGKGGAGGVVTIRGGTVLADSYDAAADDIGAGYGASQGANTILGGSVHCQSGKTGPQPVGATSTVYSVEFSGLGVGAAITNFTDDAGVSFAYGLVGVHANDDGNAWLWLPAGSRWVYVNGIRFWCAPGVYSDASLKVVGIAVNEDSITEQDQNSAGKPAWTRNGSTVHLTAAGPYVVTGSATKSRLIADHDCAIVIKGLSIDNGNATYSPIECNRHFVTVQLDGTNTLVGGSGDSGYSAINVPTNSTLVITNLSDGATLVATSGGSAAGIGGTKGEDAGLISIYGGVITARGDTDDTFFTLTSPSGAGIGGGAKGAAGDVEIYGGTVTAFGGEYAAGIGAGSTGYSGTIGIHGGSVTATGYDSAPGIGNGVGCDRPLRIQISGGTVMATGGKYCAGIGNGYASHTGSIEISGGTVTATGGSEGSGIGEASRSGTAKVSYYYDGPFTITISGGTVIANGGWSGAGIGGGSSRQCGLVTISGGTVTATGQTYGSGIGGGGGVNSGLGGCGGAVVIFGGLVSATGGVYGGAGIGGGGSDVWLMVDDTNAGTLLLAGGTVKASCGNGNGCDVGGGKNVVTSGTNTIVGGSLQLAHGTIMDAPSNGTVAVHCVVCDGFAANSKVSIDLVGSATYGTQDLYADADGKIYPWLPQGAYLIGGISTDGSTTNALLRTFVVDDAGAATSVSNITPRITGFVTNTVTAWDPPALTTNHVEVIYATNLTAAADWKGTNAFSRIEDFAAFTNAPAVFMKLRVK